MPTTAVLVADLGIVGERDRLNIVRKEQEDFWAPTISRKLAVGNLVLNRVVRAAGVLQHDAFVGIDAVEPVLPNADARRIEIEQPPLLETSIRRRNVKGAERRCNDLVRARS